MKCDNCDIECKRLIDMFMYYDPFDEALYFFCSAECFTIHVLKKVIDTLKLDK